MSKTIANLLVLIIASVAKQVNIEVSHEALLTTIFTLIQIATVAGAWYGRFSHGDITWYGKKLTH